VVVCCCVDHERAAVVVEDRGRTAGECETVGLGVQMSLAALAGDEVRQVARVSAVLRARRVVVAARVRERGGALADAWT
jgi:hypothetical protein